MYQNGERVNGYHRKRLHKKKMKKRYVKMWRWNDDGNWKTFVAKYQDQEPTKWGHPLDYWTEYHLTGPRQLAKNQTSRRLRSLNKTQIAQALGYEDFDDLPYGFSGGLYRRVVDYDGILW